MNKKKEWKVQIASESDMEIEEMARNILDEEQAIEESYRRRRSVAYY